jgi:hypothetical protein
MLGSQSTLFVVRAAVLLHVVYPIHFAEAATLSSAGCVKLVVCHMNWGG